MPSQAGAFLERLGIRQGHSRRIRAEMWQAWDFGTRAAKARLERLQTTLRPAGKRRILVAFVTKRAAGFAAAWTWAQDFARIKPGFVNHLVSEGRGALPVGRNSPQRRPSRLRAMCSWSSSRNAG